MSQVGIGCAPLMFVQRADTRFRHHVRSCVCACEIGDQFYLEPVISSLWSKIHL